MNVTRIADGLWRWTTEHPDWGPHSSGWEAQVGCVYAETTQAVVLVDPLVPISDEEATRFLTALDRDVERLGLPVAVVLTVPWHERSADLIARRYAGARVLRPGDGAVDPAGVERLLVVSAEETVVWLPSHRTLVTGDVVIGDAGGLRLCPADWLQEGVTLDDVRSQLAPVLALPVERVLPAHGEPCLDRCGPALAALLEN